MSNTPLPEPYGCVTLHTVSGLEFFYRHPEPPYLDTAKSCTVVYTGEALHAHAAAVSAAECEPLMAEIEALRQDGSRLAADNAALRAELDEWQFTNKVDELDRHVTRQAERIKVLEDALRKAIVQNEHDMLMTGEELRAARAALGDKT